MEQVLLKTGRRKRATARVKLTEGEGKIMVNGKELTEFFGGREDLIYNAKSPLRVTDTMDKFNISAKVEGGGIRGQAEAILLGIARALVALEPDLKPSLKKEGLLTRDPREVERKKYGHPKARKRFQFSKR
ncbi:30S ribosomal protein S9 [candidate division WOR-3 bacterium JGI_Cruoil_03_44_89]|uniref:Small ribosomal subunit protein uS9 n=1 Tax=candidate division WOR-3 bacterium JGI_Cruoil_03_44_89 TaxID=1973748 RepID=A0A235BZ26_UNCW3|nr:MAG: 30S ribosomal protein S9 [candidate division WOR-3 bacterium JGI_Cruoil_03_44_89]